MARTRKRESKGHRLAVVEEVADNIYSVKFILQSLGYDVRSFSWNDDYLEEIAGFKPDLVIVDMMIPGGGGYVVLEDLRASPFSRVPVLAITADAMAGDDRDVLASGGHDLLQKPYTVGDLQAKLRKWLQSGDPKSSRDGSSSKPG